MKPLMLNTERSYFGIDALRLRAATGRVLSRVEGQPPERATIAFDALAQDFQLDRGASHALVAQLVQGGMLRRVGTNDAEFEITAKFREVASAELLGPLPRTRAQMLVQHIGEVAENFNLTAAHNKYEIGAIAVFGAYMSRDAGLPDVQIGVTGRRRPAAAHPAAGRATRPTEGTLEIRKMLEDLSPHLQVNFVQKLDEVPKPFAVIFKADA